MDSNTTGPLPSSTNDGVVSSSVEDSTLAPPPTNGMLTDSIAPSDPCTINDGSAMTVSDIGNQTSRAAVTDPLASVASSSISEMKTDGWASAISGHLSMVAVTNPLACTTSTVSDLGNKDEENDYYNLPKLSDRIPIHQLPNHIRQQNKNGGFEKMYNVRHHSNNI